MSVFSVSLFLRRRSLYYTFNLIIPSFLITILSIMGFCLPPQSGEKIGLRKYFFNWSRNFIGINNMISKKTEITNLVAVAFLSQYVSTIVPSSSIGLPKLSCFGF
jgi:hypothetical protein